MQMPSAVHNEIHRLLTQMRRFCSIAVNKQLAVVGSSMHEYSVLFRLSEDHEAPQSDLAYDAAIDPAAVSRLVREMVKDGLVTTHVDPQDKRQKFVRLTAKGQTKERALAPIVDSALEPYMGGLTEREMQDFLRLLRKAHSVVAQMEDSRVDVAGAESARPKPRGKRSSLG